MRRRDLVTAVVALAAHGVGIAALATIERAPRASPTAAPDAPVTIDLEEVDPDENRRLESAPPQGGHSDAVRGDDGRASRSSRAMRTGAANAEEVLTGGFAPGTAVAGAAERAALEHGADDWSLSRDALRIDTRAAISPGLVALSVSPNTEPAPPRAASTTGGVSEALEEHDVAIGMGRGGPVLIVAEEATRASDSDVAGEATFEVTVGREGHVEARVLAAD